MILPGKLSKEKRSDYKKLFSLLRRRKSSGDDVRIAEVHGAVFEKTNCLDCANCCKSYSPLFTQRDVERIAGHLKIRPADFISKYLVLDEDNDWVFHSAPCPFLGEANICTIYEIRPAACREYPHTNRKKFYQLETITLENAGICPAVSKILDQVILQFQAS